MAETLALSGLRASELCHLRICDVRDSALYVYRGKGGKDRIVDIPPDLVTALEHWISDARVSARPEDPVFVNRQGRPFDYRRMWERSQVWLRDFLASQGLHKRLSTHGLRHSYAIRFLEIHGGSDSALVALKTQMGHSDLRSTCIYAQTSLAMRRKYANGLAIA